MTRFAEKYETPADWLKAWDNGDIVWTIEMGGLGPGYEQAIQITMFEVLRHLINANYQDADFETDCDKSAGWHVTRTAIEDKVNPKIRGLGLSGAQWGAANNLALMIYRSGIKRMDDEAVKDRHIQVSKNFPGAL